MNAVSSEKRGNVFTHNPLLWNPYVIQFSSYIEPALLSCLTDGSAREEHGSFNHLFLALDLCAIYMIA